MKRLLLILFIAIITGQAGLAPSINPIIIAKEAPISPYEAISEAVAIVESGMDNMALNRKEMAFGRYQIRQVRLDDYYLRTGKRYSLKDCYSPAVSKEIFMYYMRQFGPSRTDEAIRAWNGRGKETYAYLQKVKTVLKSKNHEPI